MREIIIKILNAGQLPLPSPNGLWKGLVKENSLVTGRNILQAD